MSGISVYKFGEKSLELNSEKSLFKPIFVFNNSLKKEVYYSFSLSDLLDFTGKLEPCNIGISFILQSGVVPPPKTVYKNLYVIGLGYKLILCSKAGKINLNFKHNFPFFFANRIKSEIRFNIDKSFILSKLYDEIQKKSIKNQRSFLSHSSGKDSNMIALALAEAGKKDVTFISHKSKAGADESEISKKISKKLGFKHLSLKEVSEFDSNQKKDIIKLFEGSTLPCTDHTSISFSINSSQIKDIINGNLIDGLSNDVYLGYVPPKEEIFKMKLNKLTSPFFKNFNSITKSNSLLYNLSRSVTHNLGFFGLSFNDSKFYENSVNISEFWHEKDKLLKDLDFIDFRGLIRGGIIDEQIFLPKYRNFSDSFGSNFIFPWSSVELIEYFQKVPENELFDRNSLRNKLFIRNILKNDLDLDSDKLGKMGYNFNTYEIFTNNKYWILDEIHKCKFWNRSEIEKLTAKFVSLDFKQKTAKSPYWRQLYQLFQLSAWLNYSKYVKF